MPELPEVENVCQSLRQLGCEGQRLARIDLLSPKLRTPLRPEMARTLKAQVVRKLARRAKYLLIETDDYVLISHLGMSGSWRSLERDENLRKHDHIRLEFSSGLSLAYNDPRRFGLFEAHAKNKIERCRWLRSLGPEPLEGEFDGAYLYTQSLGRELPIKNLIMNQKIVVGVGNIYATEALFRARVRPTRRAAKMIERECVRLVAAIKDVLAEAISSGGSTIRDYRKSDGSKGSFQDRFAVYGRVGQPCPVCADTVRARVIGGRNSFWCGSCQR